MLKQITIENLYNFKDEIVLDMTNRNGKGILSHKFDKESITNFTLLYGKNNLGKTNFFRIINDAMRFIFSGENHLRPYEPTLEENYSIFEIIFEDDKHEYRYGFELLIDSIKITDEWFYSRINHSSRETTIFERKSERFHKSIGKGLQDTLLNLKETKLFMNQLDSLDHNIESVDGLITELKKIKVIHCAGLGESLGPDAIESFQNITKSKQNSKLLKYFLKSFDLDIQDINVIELDAREKEFIDKMRTLDLQSFSHEEREIHTNSILSEYEDVIPNVIRRNIMGYQIKDGAFKYSSVEFVHRSGATYSFENLSTGTKQILKIFLALIDGMESNRIMFFDEIEIGLHQDLVELLIEIFKVIVEIKPQIQFMISTHSSTLLDSDFISKENKALLKYENNKLIMDYLSNYEMREYHVPSKRYQLDAFDTNPNTVYMSELKSQVLTVQEEVKNSDNE